MKTFIPQDLILHSRIGFHLENGRFGVGINHEVFDLFGVEIANPNGLDQTFLDELFHGLPSLQRININMTNASILVLG